MSSRLERGALSLREPTETVERIVRFLKTHTDRIGAKCLVLGMSGGLDSSVCAVLCAMAMGGRKTLGLSLTESLTRNPTSVRDAEDVAKKHSISFKSLDITGVFDETVGLVHAPRRRASVTLGNIKARIRAVILYYYANANDGLVVGTGDKSEIMLGYFTKYGDGASDILPIGDLYKTTVMDLARYLKLPSRIYSKPSSPELWPGQTAEKELGLSYEKLDRILWALERWVPATEISRELEIPLKRVESIRQRWLTTEHKRRPPLTMKLGYRTAGQDLRIPYSLPRN